MRPLSILVLGAAIALSLPIPSPTKESFGSIDGPEPIASERPIPQPLPPEEAPKSQPPKNAEVHHAVPSIDKRQLWLAFRGLKSLLPSMAPSNPHFRSKASPYRGYYRRRSEGSFRYEPTDGNPSSKTVLPRNSANTSQIPCSQQPKKRKRDEEPPVYSAVPERLGKRGKPSVEGHAPVIDTSDTLIAIYGVSRAAFCGPTDKQRDTTKRQDGEKPDEDKDKAPENPDNTKENYNNNYQGPKTGPGRPYYSRRWAKSNDQFESKGRSVVARVARQIEKGTNIHSN